MKRRLLLVALAVSAAFNLGFVTTAAMRYSPQAPTGLPCSEPGTALSPENTVLAAQLKEQLAPLRLQQASDTRQLAQLIAAEEPDRAAIGHCLDRLAAAGREIHQIVIDTILAQQDALPEAQRGAFCRAVQQRLCDPWAGCTPEDCSSPTHPHPTKEEPK